MRVALDYTKAKKAQIKADKARKAAKKAQAAKNKRKNEAEAQERALQCQVKRGGEGSGEG
jgi:hypothetical protein